MTDVIPRQSATRRLRQNLFFAFVHNALGVPIAAGVFYPWTSLLLSSIIASAAMLSSATVARRARDRALGLAEDDDRFAIVKKREVQLQGNVRNLEQDPLARVAAAQIQRRSENNAPRHS